MDKNGNKDRHPPKNKRKLLTSNRELKPGQQLLNEEKQ